MTAGGAAAALQSLLDADPARTGVFTDFDGTLSPIVDDPDAARPVEGARQALAALAARVARVGVISGRPAEFLRQHLTIAGVSLWGLHGLETVADDHVVPVPAARPWLAVVADAAAAARRDLAGIAGVEHKAYALTLHYRTAPEAQPVIAQWVASHAKATGLTVYPARMSYELRPPVPHGKDVTLEQAAADLDAACFIGDDAGDAVAFDALDRLVAARPGFVAVRIAVTSDEAPADLLARADLIVDGPPGVVDVLGRLAQPGAG